MTNLPSTVPHAVREKLENIRELKLERGAAIQAISQDRRASIDALAKLKERVAELGRLGKPARQEAERVQRDLESERAVLDKLNARIDRLRPGWEWASTICESLEQYVRAHAGKGFALHEEVPQLRNGETALEGMERTARRARELQADRRVVLAAPLPSAVAKKIAREQLELRIEAAKPNVGELIDRGGPIKFPTSLAAIEQFDPAAARDATVIDAVGIVGWIFQDQLLAAIDNEIDAIAEDEIALSVEQRLEKLAVIDADILHSEREECAFSELAGLLPRADVDPRALLCLASSMPAPERA